MCVRHLIFKRSLRRVPGYRNKAYMGKAVVHAEADAVADLFRTSDAQVIRKYNPVYASGYDVEELNVDEKVSALPLA